MTKPERCRNVGTGVVPKRGRPVLSHEAEHNERVELADRIDRLRRQQRMTIADVALKAGYDERTVRNVLAAKPTKPRTLQHICEAVGLKDPGASVDVAEFADASHGAYCSKTTALYAGTYEAYRWSYDRSKSIVRSVFQLSWSSKSKAMTFTEHQRYVDATGRKVDFSQSGDLYTSDSTGLVHLLTIADGMLRLITLTKLQMPDLVMKGVVLTQARMSFYRQPAISPLLLHKLAEPLAEADLPMLMGEVAPGEGGYAALAAQLREVEQDVVLSTLAGPMPARRRSDMEFAEEAEGATRQAPPPN